MQPSTELHATSPNAVYRALQYSVVVLVDVEVEVDVEEDVLVLVLVLGDVVVDVLVLVLVDVEVEEDVEVDVLVVVEVEVVVEKFSTTTALHFCLLLFHLHSSGHVASDPKSAHTGVGAGVR